MQLNLQGGAGGSIDVSPVVFDVKFNEPLIHQVVTAHLAALRRGTKAQKSRSEVRGGGSKPWRQKGTGRARSGTIRSPLWRGGGMTFAAKPRDYSQKVNKKMYQGAMRSILSELARQERLIVLEQFTVSQPKTKQLVAQLNELGLKEVLIVLDQPDTNLILAARNLYKVEVCEANSINPVNLIHFNKVLMTVPALKQIEERLT